MPDDKDTLRNEDLRSINERIDSHHRETGLDPERGRIVQDRRGRRVVYNVVNGRPVITGYNE